MARSRSGFLFLFSPRLSAQERKVLVLQIGVIFVIISLLDLGFFYMRELLEIEAQQKLHRVMRSWDGWEWYVWLLAVPATLILIRRCPWERSHALRSLGRLALGSLGIYLVIAHLRYGLRMFPNLWLPDDRDLPLNWSSYLHTESVLLPIDFLTYCGFFATSFAIDQYFKYRQHAAEVLQLQLEAAQLQSELAQAQLSTLLRQLQPHFLFNAFNAISTFVRQRKNEEAVAMIAELGELLRLAMDNIDHREVPLERDLDFVKHYLNVERVRFGEKLQIELVVESETLACLVPNLLLQPLVENAIKHGISRRVSPGALRLEAYRFNHRLRVVISDDGPEDGPKAASRDSTGIGLSNTRSRLRHVYGTDFHLQVEARPEGGTIVRIELPWREKSPHLEPVAERVVLV